MKRRFMSATLALLLLTTPSWAQTIDDQTAKPDLLGYYLNYAKENLALIGTTAALASSITAAVFFIVGRTRAQPIDPAQQRRDALALLAAAAQIVHPQGAPHLGGGDLPPGADSLSRSAILRPPTAQLDLSTEQERRRQVTMSLQTGQAQEQGASAAATSAAAAARAEQPSRTSQQTASARAAAQSLPRASMGSVSRRIGQKPRVSPAVEKLETLVGRLNDINSDSGATSLRKEIIAHLQSMTPEEIGEAAQAPFFWDKLLSEPQGGPLFFIALTVEQLKSALRGMLTIWPLRGTIELIDIVDDRIAYLLQPIGNSIDHCLQGRIVDLLLLQLRAILDQHVANLQNVELDVNLRRAMQQHAKLEKNLRSILGKLKTACKEEPSLQDIGATLLPQVLEIEEILKASRKMELPQQLDMQPQ